MNLFSPMLRLFGIGSLSNNDNGKQTGTSGGISTDAGISVSDERAMKVSAVWACVNYIVNSTASLPLEFYTKTKDGREPLERGYLNALFHDSPNALMKPRDFRKAMTTQMCLWSNAYAEIMRNGNGTPIAIVPLRPGRMTPYMQDGVLTYHYQMEQGVRIYSKNSILHLKGLGVDGIVGLERVSYARDTLGLSVSADVYASKQFAHGGRPGGGYLMFDDFLTQKQRTQARELYEGMSETAYEKGKMWILEGGVKYETDALNPDTMQMIDTRKMQLGEIARFFGVPEVMIGAGDAKGNAWPASFEQQILSFLTFTLQDYLDEWECGIRECLMTPADRRKIIVDHDVSGFIKMDSTAKAELQSKWAQNGLKTRNEIRKINNDPPVEGGDDLTVQVNLMPIDKLGQVQEAPDTGTTNPPDDDEKSELKHQVLTLESECRIVEKMPILEKADPVIVNISMPSQLVPKVEIQNDVHVPPQKQPIVNVKNDVKTPVVQNQVNPPDVKVTVPIPAVTVENTVNVPCDEKDKKVKFTRNRNGDITEATLEDDG